MLPDGEKRRPHDALVSKYDDRMGVFKYELGRLIVERHGHIGQDEWGGSAGSDYQEEHHAWEGIKTIIIVLLVYLWKMLL